MKPYLPQMPSGYQWADDLPGYFWDSLRGRAPEQAAAATGAELDRGRFILTVFASRYLVDPENRRVYDLARADARVDYHTALVLVTHLARAVDTPPGRLRPLTPARGDAGPIPPGRLPGGDRQKALSF